MNQFASPHPLIQALSDLQLESLLAHTPNPIHRSILTLLADTGLRNAELRHLLVADLWMLGQPLNCLEVRAAIAKNHKPRSIPLTPRCTSAIQDLCDKHWVPGISPLEHYALYSANPRVPLSTHTIHRICQRYGRTILNISLHPHMLRHTFATRLMRKCPIRVVQQLLGHASLVSTQIYTHPNTQDLQSAIDALNESQY